jgi:hypothetical protein
MSLRIVSSAFVVTSILVAGAFAGCAQNAPPGNNNGSNGSGYGGDMGTGGTGGAGTGGGTTTSTTGGGGHATTSKGGHGQGGQPSGGNGQGGQPSGGNGQGGQPGGGAGQGGQAQGGSGAGGALVDAGGACAHDVCTTGAALNAACDPCVAKVCAKNADAYCCNNKWDQTCVDKDVPKYCGTSCGDAGVPPADGGGGDGGLCPHDVCAEGAALDPSCSQCAKDVCAQDPACCDPANGWDTVCVNGDVQPICGIDCSGAGDGGAPDAGPADAGSDAGPVDAGSDAGPVDGGGACGIGHLVISELRSRGPAGAGDEFVELYNPTASPVTLDKTWTLDGKSVGNAAYSTRWTGSGGTIPAHGHYLVVGSTYSNVNVVADSKLSNAITDAASLVLNHSAVAVDAVCYADTAANLAKIDATFTCEGTPVLDPQAGANTDTSIERKPGGLAGNCTDTGNNSADFAGSTPSTPLDAASPLTP